jgi:serine/threonine protein kinase
LLLLEIEYRRRRGEEPIAGEYLARFPDDGPLVAEVFGVAAVPAVEELAAGQRVGRYVIERLLGGGSFGRVYLAWDSGLERRVALKMPLAVGEEEARGIEDFIEEARTASKIDHPAIVPVLDVVRDPGSPPAIIMPYIEGCSLRDRMTQQRLTFLEATTLIIEVADAMDFAHRRGFVHRDLKPRNILLDSAGRPHITDFGLALHESQQRSRAGESAGSLAYMSPEQLRGQANWLDGRSDIWALGVILYELLTGRRPFEGRTVDELASEIFARDPKPPRQIDAAIPAELERICLTCLSKPISGRYATARDLADALRQGLSAWQPGAGSEEPDSVVKASSRLTRSMLVVGGLLAAGVWVLLLTVALGGADWISRPNSPVAVQDIDLTVYSQDDEYRGQLNRTSFMAAPLRTGDKVRLTVRVSRPTYLYVLWIGTDGDVAPLHPWPAGKWTRPAAELEVAEVRLPEALDQTWQVQPGMAGVETIIVLTARRPLPADLDLEGLLQSARPQEGVKLGEPLWFENGHLQSRTRSPNVVEPVQLADAVVANQLSIQARLNGHIRSMYALCIPLSGE